VIGGGGGAVGSDNAVLNRAALLPFYAALANRNSAQVPVLFIGDSITEGARSTGWTNHFGYMFAKRLMAMYPCAAGNPVGGYYLPAAQLSGNGPSIPVSYSGSTPSPQQYYGPGFVNVQLTSANTATFTVTGTSCNLWVIQATSTRTFQTSIDAGSPVTQTVPGNSPTKDGYLVNLVLGAAGSHTVAITYTGNNVSLAGIDVFNGDETIGVHPIFGGHSGWGANDYVTAVNTQTAQVTSLTRVAAAANPALIVVMLGTNDYGKGVESSALFQGNLQQMITWLQAGAPNAAILLVAPFQPVQQNTPLESFTNYVSAMKAAAQNTNVAFVNLSSVMPAATAANTYGLYYSDQIHPAQSGHAMIADLLASTVSLTNLSTKDA
jgi:lysophospholipase L1-like esterase